MSETNLNNEQTYLESLHKMKQDSKLVNLYGQTIENEIEKTRQKIKELKKVS